MPVIAVGWHNTESLYTVVQLMKSLPVQDVARIKVLSLSFRRRGQSKWVRLTHPWVFWHRSKQGNNCHGMKRET